MTIYDPDPLRVGERVRVRVRGECRVDHESWLDGDAGRVNGAEGVVIAVEPDTRTTPPEERGHIYYVTDNPDHASRGFDRVDGFFARIELERLP